MEVDIKKYDMHAQSMTQDRSNKKLLILKVRDDSLCHGHLYAERKESNRFLSAVADQEKKIYIYIYIAYGNTMNCCYSIH